MPLVDNAVYTIHNDLTRTVLDVVPLALNQDVYARGWGWHGRQNQQWKAIKTNNGRWRFQNLEVNDNQRRFLSADANLAESNRLRRAINPDEANSTFVITPIGSSGGCRISRGGNVVTLVLGAHTVPVINDGVLDLQADGAPIALRAEAAPADPENNKRAQIWSFVPVAQLPIQNGTYKIMNSKTGTVLGFENDEENAVQGRVSQDNAALQQWTVTKEQNGDCYELKVGTRFLGLGPAPQGGGAEPVAADGTALHGRVDAQKKLFTIRRVPNTQYYKIFLAPTADGVSRFAVNLARIPDADGPAQPHGLRNPNPANGAAVSLNETDSAQTQTWAFI